MPIGPKHRLGETGPTVARQFTDRERFIDVFEQVVSELSPKEYKILVYYGVGGIGKTSLRIELSRLLEEQHPQTIWWATLDFYTPTHRNIETALFWLRQELKEKYGVQFPSFDLAYVIFWQKSRPQAVLRRDSSGLEALTEEGSLFADLLSIVGQVPILSLVPQISRTILKTNQLLKEWWTKRGRRELYELQGMSPAQITERLPMFWAADLKDFMQREGRPAVMFIDTYEALWEGVEEGRFFSQDAWVRELVLHLPGVLWVITGRERLRWEELDEDWRNYQRQHLVGGLAENDAQRFLATCGITEEALQKVIVEGSKGVPLYLDLAVDTYLQIKVTQQRDPYPSDFRGTPREVFERFLRYLDRSETHTLKVLSATRFWDRTLFELLIEEFNTGFPATALPELCRFSFVQEEQTPGTWTIHPLMREAMEEYLDDELSGRVHRYLFDYYDQALQGLESTAIGDVHKIALTEAYHHGKYVLATEELFEWFTTARKSFWRGWLWQFLTPLQEEFARLIEHRLGPEHTATASSRNDLAIVYYYQGRYEKAEALLKRALEVREKVLGPEHPNTSVSLSCLANLYEAQGRYEKAEPLYERALRIDEKVLGPEHPNTAVALGLLAGLYCGQGRYKEAEPLCKRALRINEKVLSPEHPNTAKALDTLAGLYCGQGRYEEAEPLYERALRINEKVLGPEHPMTAASLNHLAFPYCRRGRYEEAESLYKRALEINEKILGPEHPDTVSSFPSLAALNFRRGRYKEAEPLFERALEAREKVLGPEHPETATNLNNLARLYRLKGRYEVAESLLKRGLEVREKVLGPEHPDTTAILNSLAGLLRDQGRYEEAERLTQRPKLELYLADEDNQIVYENDNSLAYVHATLVNVGKAAANNVQGRLEFEPSRVYPINRTPRSGWPKIHQHITATSGSCATLYLGSLVPRPYSTEHTWQARLLDMPATPFQGSPRHLIVPVRVAAEGQTRLFCSFVCDEGSKVETSKLLDFPKRTKS